MARVLLPLLLAAAAPCSTYAQVLAPLPGLDALAPLRPPAQELNTPSLATLPMLGGAPAAIARWPVPTQILEPLPGLESGLIGIGILDGDGSGNGILLGISALGGGDSGQASQGLGIGVLNQDELIHLQIGGAEVVGIPLANGIGNALHDLLRALTVPVGNALPNLNLLPGISLLGGDDLTSSNPLLNLGLLVGDNAGSGGAVGIALISGRDTAEASLIGIGVLNLGDGGESGRTGESDIGILDGERSGRGDLLGISVLGGDGSGTAERGIGLGLLNDGEILHLEIGGQQYLLIPALPAPLDALEIPP